MSNCRYAFVFLVVRGDRFVTLEIVVENGGLALRMRSQQTVTHGVPAESNKAFRHQTLFVHGRYLVPSRPAIGWRGLFTFRQPIAGLRGTKFLPWKSKFSSFRKVLLYRDRFYASFRTILLSY